MVLPLGAIAESSVEADDDRLLDGAEEAAEWAGVTA
jgi:hypothetical protein